MCSSYYFSFQNAQLRLNSCLEENSVYVHFLKRTVKTYKIYKQEWFRGVGWKSRINCWKVLTSCSGKDSIHGRPVKEHGISVMGEHGEKMIAELSFHTRSPCEGTWANLGDPIRENLGAPLWENLGNPLLENLGDPLWESMGAEQSFAV